MMLSTAGVGLFAGAMLATMMVWRLIRGRANRTAALRRLDGRHADRNPDRIPAVMPSAAWDAVVVLIFSALAVAILVIAAALGR